MATSFLAWFSPVNVDCQGSEDKAWLEADCTIPNVELEARNGEPITEFFIEIALELGAGLEWNADEKAEGVEEKTEVADVEFEDVPKFLGTCNGDVVALLIQTVRDIRNIY